MYFIGQVGCFNYYLVCFHAHGDRLKLSNGMLMICITLTEQIVLPTQQHQKITKSSMANSLRKLKYTSLTL